MSLLFRVLAAAHANGTHHKLALNALEQLAGSDAEGWRRLFLLHAEAYMAGAKAPDDEFKDFKNHVLHPRDGYWGGAPELACEWFDRTVAALKAGEWREAVRAAGVLSHYVTDPMHPFHTAQSDAESNIHRAVEWSISRAFDSLYADASARSPLTPVTLGEGPKQLKALMCANADRSNAHYESLIAHYDIKVGISDPPSGLDPVARRIVGALLVEATATVAAVLDRAITAASVAPPQVGLTLATVVATLRIPRKLIEKRLSNAEDRRIVSAMYDELMATGSVVVNLPEDDRVVRDLYAAEIQAPRLTQRAEARARRVEATEAPTSPALRSITEIFARSSLGERLAAAAGGSDGLSSLSTRPRSIAQPPPLPDPNAPRPYTPSMSASDASALMAAIAASSTQRHSVTELEQPRQSAPASRLYLSVGDDVERAPSIGPKTAERLAKAGIKTVADLLAADPAALAAQLASRLISAREITDWQDQARLICTVPGLRGAGAQLLVAAGYRTVAAIADAEVNSLCADVLKLATTDEGLRILRDGYAPDIEKIKMWAENARLSRAA